MFKMSTAGCMANLFSFAAIIVSGMALTTSILFGVISFKSRRVKTPGLDGTDKMLDGAVSVESAASQ